MSDLPSWSLFTLRDTSSVLTTWQLGTHSKWSKRARRKSQCSRVICVIIQVGLTRPGRDNLGHEYHGAGSLVSMWGADHASYNWGTSSFSTNSHFQCVDTRKISEMCWSWWHGTSFRAMGYLHQPVLERPHSSLATDAHIMTRNLLTPLSSQGVEETCSPIGISSLQPYFYVFFFFSFFTALVGVKWIS